MSKRFAKLAGRYGPRPARLHDLRHLNAGLLISAGVDIAAVSKRLRHKTIGVSSDIYGHLFAAASKEIADKGNRQVPWTRPA